MARLTDDEIEVFSPDIRRALAGLVYGECVIEVKGGHIANVRRLEETATVINGRSVPAQNTGGAQKTSTALTIDALRQAFVEGREARCLSRVQVANACGLTPMSLSNFESGRIVPPVNTLFELLRHVGVSVSLETGQPND